MVGNEQPSIPVCISMRNCQFVVLQVGPTRGKETTRDFFSLHVSSLQHTLKRTRNGDKRTRLGN